MLFRSLFGLTAGQAVVWYSGQFYALFFMQNVIKVDSFTANVLVAWSLILGTGGFLFFGALSDRIGRKPIILAGCLIAAITYLPVFNFLTKTANPALYAAHQTPVTVTANEADCSFQFNPTNTVTFSNSCDVAKALLARTSVNYKTVYSPDQSIAELRIGDAVFPSYDGGPIVEAQAALDLAKKGTDQDAIDSAKAKLADESVVKTAFGKRVSEALIAAGYPELGSISAIIGPSGLSIPVSVIEAEHAVGSPDVIKVVNLLTELGVLETTFVEKNNTVAVAQNFIDIFTAQKLTIIAVLTYLIILVTMVYGPIAAMLVELFPTRIRYSGLSLPYHIGNGWFGGLMPATAFAISAQTGNIYAGLWYAIVVALMTVVIGTLFVPGGTHKKDIFADDQSR